MTGNKEGGYSSAAVVSRGAFRYERDLVAAFSHKIESVIGNGRYVRRRVAFETAVGGVIPDIIVADYRRAFSVRKQLSLIDRHVLVFLQRERRELSQDELVDTLYISAGALESSLARLIRAEFVRERSSKYVCAKPVSRSVQITAVEVKLRRWRQALHQAIQYRSFADRSIVVLDESQVQPSRAMMQTFKDANVGLVTFSRGASVATLLVKARSQSPLTVDRLEAVQKLSLAI